MSNSCNSMDCGTPGSPVHGISQARILEWVLISFTRASSWPGIQTWVSWIGRVLYNRATRETLIYNKHIQKKMWHIYTMEYYWAIKKVNNNIYSNIDEPTDYHTKWCKSERERKIPYDISYLRNLKNYINAIKLQSSRPYGTGTETEIQINGTRQKVQR